MSNRAIAWEKTSEINYGLDLGLFKGLLNVELDFYKRKTTNMLLNKALPMISGFNNVTKNIGSVGNSGVEFSINSVIIDNNDFSWNASFNISANRSEVLDLGGVDKMIESRNVGNASSNENVLIQVGKPLGLLYGFQLEGIRSTWASESNTVNSSSYWYNTEREGLYGWPSLADINGDGIVNRLDKTIIGRVLPNFIGGFSQRFNYKFLELSMDFSYSVGNEIVNGNFYDLTSYSMLSNKLKTFWDAVWFADNGGTIPGPGPGDWTGRGRWEGTPSEIVENGSFLRMNNISLGVNLPKRLIPNSIKSIKVNYSISNLFTLTSYSGYDPDVSTGNSGDNRILPGVDKSAYPTSRTHLLSLNINF